MKLKLLIFVLLKFKLFIAITAFQFEEITNEIFPLGEDTGVIASFSHLNSDEFTDVISLQSGGNRLQLLKGSENRPYFQRSFNCSFGSVITSVVPGDYNGDSVLDILIALGRDEKSDIKILWGTNGTIDCKTEPLFTLSSQPFIVDFNGDMIPDIIGEITADDTTERYVWISSPWKNFTKLNLSGMVHQKFKSPQHSSGLIDLNNNMAPDILVTGEHYLETWYNTGKEFIINDTSSIPYPHNAIYKFQTTFVDMNLDGKTDLIMPICTDRKCDSSEVLIWNANLSDWETLTKDFINPNDKSHWGFKLLTISTLETALAVTLRAGDVDMDGYPDFITVLQSKEKQSIANTRAIIMRNVPCKSCYSGRKLQIEWDVPGLKDVPNAQIAAFFDLYEDGILDILVSSNTKSEWKIHALRNTEIYDSCFLKVLVLSGLCHHDCTTGAYGINQPGPVVRYNMSTQDGQPLVSSSVQLSQSAHFPLQLPYTVFGLGQTPNFIDVLTVSVPAKFNESVHKRQWIQIIPNSQIVVIPNPPYDERKWVKKLFVTPSHLVLLTCISLVGTCIFLCLLVALLHWKERREDKKEKMQDACRFPFDAM